MAGSAMVTGDNLMEMGNNLFVTRLPVTYSETNRVVGEAVRNGRWEDVGTDSV